jgi:hypothetical protein
MAITYTWELTSLKKKNVGNLTDFVAQTYWKKIGTDENGLVGEFSGATPFTPAADMDPATFISFEALTEAQVLGWIQAVVTGSYEAHVNEQIQKQIDAKKNPETEVASGKFPWSPVTS